MLEHPDCSLEEMISMLGLPRSFSDNPLYQAAFSMRPFETGKLELAGIPMEYVPVFTGTAKTELFIELVLEEEEFRLQFLEKHAEKDRCRQHQKSCRTQNGNRQQISQEQIRLAAPRHGYFTLRHHRKRTQQ